MADTFIARAISLQRRAFYRRAWRRLLEIASIFIGASAVMGLYAYDWVIPAWPLPIVAMVLLWMVGQSSIDGTYHLINGMDAERWTSAELQKLRHAGWTHINNVPFEHEDVDHVALRGRRVFAIETKTTDGHLDLGDIPGLD